MRYSLGPSSGRFQGAARLAISTSVPLPFHVRSGVLRQTFPGCHNAEGGLGRGWDGGCFFSNRGLALPDFDGD